MKSKIGLVGYFVAIFLLSFNSINIKTAAADVSVDIDDTIQWKFYLYGVYDDDIIMTITNVSSNGGVLIVEGNIKFGVGTIIDQGELIWFNGVTLTVAGQASMLGYGGIGLLPTPLDLSLLNVIFTNYTIVGNIITEVVGTVTWQLTYNDYGILTVGKLFVSGIETYRLSLASSDSSISFGYSAIIILSIGIIFLAIKKRKSVKLT